MKVYESIWRLFKVYEGIWQYMEVFKVYQKDPPPASLPVSATLFDLIRPYSTLFWFILPYVAFALIWLNLYDFVRSCYILAYFDFC